MSFNSIGLTIMGPSAYASSLNIIYIHYGNQEVASQIR